MMLIPMEAMPGYVVPMQEMCYPSGEGLGILSFFQILLGFQNEPVAIGTEVLFQFFFLVRSF